MKNLMETKVNLIYIIPSFTSFINPLGNCLPFEQYSLHTSVVIITRSYYNTGRYWQSKMSHHSKTALLPPNNFTFLKSVSSNVYTQLV